MERPEQLQHTAFISVGSNMGDRLANCKSGIDALAAASHSRITGVSQFYQTAPVDYEDQEWFVNAAVRIRTCLSPSDLLAEIQDIEAMFGRDRAETVRFGPRTLDMDIIFYDDLVLETPELTLPHPRMHERRFVLQPLCDVDGAFVHPVSGKSVRALLAHLADSDQPVVSFDAAGH